MLINFSCDKLYCPSCHFNIDGSKALTLKQCCGNAPALWKDGNWSCSECDSIVQFEEQLDIFGNQAIPKVSKVAKCDCGASKTNNPNCHANWCSTGGNK